MFFFLGDTLTLLRTFIRRSRLRFGSLMMVNIIKYLICFPGGCFIEIWQWFVYTTLQGRGGGAINFKCDMMVPPKVWKSRMDIEKIWLKKLTWSRKFVEKFCVNGGGRFLKIN